MLLVGMSKCHLVECGQFLTHCVGHVDFFLFLFFVKSCLNKLPLTSTSFVLLGKFLPCLGISHISHAIQCVSGTTVLDFCHTYNWLKDRAEVERILSMMLDLDTRKCLSQIQLVNLVLSHSWESP